jgi:hypothetical protein
MTVELAPASSDFLTVLTQATTAFQEKRRDRPAPEVVMNALLQAEKNAKRTHLLYPFEPLLGDWQLCFASGTRKVKRGGIVLGKGFYVPQVAIAQISFQAEADAVALGHGTIGNQVAVSPVLLRFTGPAYSLGKKNLLAFDFTHVQVNVLGKTVYSGTVPGRKPNSQGFYDRAVGELPFFTFFLVTPALIAARGRGGGLALWVRAASR